MIIPWQVDVPQDKHPVANWLVVAACLVVAALQVQDFVANESGGITDAWALRGWGLKGLLGYMWLHGGFWHLLGNMWFLWVFGNAVCANIGNLRYPPVYVALGIAAGMAHLIASPHPAIGASGAINGIVGMYLVMFPQNEITCYFWFFLVYVRQFTVSSYWMILFWLFWDIVGALKWGSSGVAHFAHLGGFAAGVGMGVLFCKKGWCLLDEYDRSLVQIWEERRKSKQGAPHHPARVPPGYPGDDLEPRSKVSDPMPAPVPKADPIDGMPIPASSGPICACGERISVSPQYANKVVQCPRCRARVRIPPLTSPSPVRRPRPAAASRAGCKNRQQAIRFACPCGKKIKVPARYAGRFGTCPRCGTRLRIPLGTHGTH